MADYRDVYYKSFDDRLKLYARDYGCPRDGAMPVLMLHGLTRNSADFEFIAAHLSPNYHVISVDVRGRGKSEWDPIAQNYQPAIYAQDMIRLLDHLIIPKVALIGTSMGGLMSMILGVTARDRILGIALNDVGPELDPKGLDRIRSYVGKGKKITTWEEAALATEASQRQAFPEFKHDDWLAFAKRTYVEDETGCPVLAYDPVIAAGLKLDGDAPTVPPDLWPLWDGLAGIPILAIRGAISDLLSAQTLDRMGQKHEGMRKCVVRNRGHAPLLDEGEAVTAIEDFLRFLETGR